MKDLCGAAKNAAVNHTKESSRKELRLEPKGNGKKTCDIDVMVACNLAKVNARVRFPHIAPRPRGLLVMIQDSHSCEGSSILLGDTNKLDNNNQP